MKVTEKERIFVVTLALLMPGVLTGRGMAPGLTTEQAIRGKASQQSTAQAPNREIALMFLLSMRDRADGPPQGWRVAELTAAGLTELQAHEIIDQANTFGLTYDRLQAQLRQVKASTELRPYPQTILAQFDEISTIGWRSVSDAMTGIATKVGPSGNRALYSYIANKVTPNVVTGSGK